eukprot:5570777-Pleurochrysis_carterae.AAC.1
MVKKTKDEQDQGDEKAKQMHARSMHSARAHSMLNARTAHRSCWHASSSTADGSASANAHGL